MTATQSVLSFAGEPDGAIPGVACAFCWTEEGYRLPGDAYPRRFSGARFGLAGMVCDSCRQKLQRNPGAAPAPRPDSCADGWASCDDERERLRDAHRLRAAYAATMARLEGIGCREAWRRVVRLVAMGNIVLPATPGKWRTQDGTRITNS